MPYISFKSYGIRATWPIRLFNAAAIGQQVATQLAMQNMYNQLAYQQQQQQQQQLGVGT